MTRYFAAVTVYGNSKLLSCTLTCWEQFGSIVTVQSRQFAPEMCLLMFGCRVSKLIICMTSLFRTMKCKEIVETKSYTFICIIKNIDRVYMGKYSGRSQNGANNKVVSVNEQGCVLVVRTHTLNP